MKEFQKSNSTKIFSFVEYLKKSKSIDGEFFDVLSSLSLEEIICLKLELASMFVKNKIYGVPLWHNLTQIVKEAVFNYAHSVSESPSEAAMLLGLNTKEHWKISQLLETWKHLKSRQNMLTDLIEDLSSHREGGEDLCGLDSLDYDDDRPETGEDFYLGEDED
jgi:hypothetical protein